MGVRSFVKNTFKDNTNVKGWISWHTIAQNAKFVKRFVDDIKVEPNAPSASTETFEAAAARFGLTDSQLQKRMKTHYRIALGCSLLGILALGWCIFILLKGMFLSSLIALSLSGLMFAYAFSEHFSYFRIKQKRLNCTVDEWVSAFFSTKK